MVIRSAKPFPALGAVRAASVAVSLLASAASTNDMAFAREGMAQQDAGAGEEKVNAQNPIDLAKDGDAKDSVCLMVESAAKSNGLLLDFFVRVIWQESRFQSGAVGPVTRNGQRALGIAQFMPETARERRVLDPFDPVQALPKAAEFLNELRKQFGNLGLAAAAYNAGPRRVQQWLAGSGGMPRETRSYVQAITGIAVEDWAGVDKDKKLPDSGERSNCRELIALLNRAPNRFVAQLERSVMRDFLKPWGVQVAAGFGRDQALVMYARAMKGLTAIAHPQGEPILFRASGTSSFYQVRIATNTRREAYELCGRIRNSGGACLVKRKNS